MRVLIIATYFPPNAEIAAVRPYMFAKYLQKLGHEVEVLWRGVDGTARDASNLFPTDAFVVHTYEEGTDSQETGAVSGKSRLWFLPYKVRKPLAAIYHRSISVVTARRNQSQTEEIVNKLKAAIDKLSDRQFDVVISTFGNIENVYAGRYAAKIFGCKWAMDFRDPVTGLAKNRRQWKEYRNIQDQAIRDADLSITVSEDLARNLSRGTGRQVYAVYNGYDETEAVASNEMAEGISFCYTGAMYEGRRKLSPLLEVLSKMISAGELKKEELVFHYAGRNFEELQHQVGKYGLQDCSRNHGFLSRKDVEQLQRSSDFYVVLSWNNPNEVGVLTGKFYEGLRAEKPIIGVISGTKPNSELRHIIEKYSLGCCYEDADREKSQEKMQEYLRQQIRHKKERGCVKHQCSQEARTAFRYDTIVEKLEKMLLQLTDESANAHG